MAIRKSIAKQELIMKKIISENFNNPQLSPNLYWFNEPPNWMVENGKLIISPSKSDFWCKTHYGFTFDNGHCLFHKTSSDFILRTKLNIYPKHQYDQAGLMVRINPDFWLKTSVEFENEILSRLGVVVTNFGYSDWSTQDIDSKIQEIELRVEKSGMDFTVAFKLGKMEWSQLRISHLHQNTDSIQCGLYACCPVETGFRAEFQFMEIQSI
jgi:regulation of enolase protein 1 (concanavalin A-like superfamily)